MSKKILTYYHVMSIDLSNISITLERPSLRLKDSYIECLKEFQKEDLTRPIKWEWFEHFDLYLKWCEEELVQTDQDGVPTPQTTYWIVYDEKYAVGKLTFRHALTPRLEKIGGHFGYEIRPSFRKRGIASRALALGLEKAREAGIGEIIITCDDNNLGSIRVLEKNGGIMVEKYTLSNWPRPIRKYVFKSQPLG